MMVLISYDVSTTSSAGRTRLRKVAKECQNHAQRFTFERQAIKINRSGTRQPEVLLFGE